MPTTKLSKIIHHAEHACHSAGVKLTPKRKKVLTTLLKNPGALSAYEVAERYSQLYSESIPVMSVYRMLDFLASENLVHKLSTINKYIACSHIACDHRHEIPQFMICDNCEQVDEVGMSKTLIANIEKNLTQAGFHLNNQQLEFHGLCRRCYPQ